MSGGDDVSDGVVAVQSTSSTSKRRTRQDGASMEDNSTTKFRSLMACQRCRHRKTRCDNKLPRCSGCERSNSLCVSFDPVTNREVPRSHSMHLEERIAYLELLLRNSGVPYDSSDTETESRSRASSVSKDTNASSVLSKLMVSSLYSASGRSANGSQEERLTKEALISFDSDKNGHSPSRLPKRHEANRLVDAYFDHSYIQLPVISREAIEAITTRIYSSPSKGSAEDYFLYYIILAIGSGIVSHEEVVLEGTPEGYYASAILTIDAYLNTKPKLRPQYELEAFMLLGIYGLLRPTRPGVWYLVRSAVWLCVEMGLHDERTFMRRESKEECDKLRRLFWCTYALDRQVGSYLSRPFSLSDLDITSALPQKTSTGAVALQIFRIRLIQSEIQQVLFRGTPTHTSIGSPYIQEGQSLTEWRKDIVKRLDNWLLECPMDKNNDEAGFSSNFLTLAYHQMVFDIYRHSPQCPELSVEDTLRLYNVSDKIIRTYRSLLLIKRINYKYLTVHNVFVAAITNLHCVWTLSAQDPSTIAVDKIDSTTLAALSVLNALVKHCPAAQECHDTLQRMVHGTIEAILSFSSTTAVPPSYSTDSTSVSDANLETPTFHTVSGCRARQLSLDLRDEWATMENEMIRSFGSKDFSDLFDMVYGGGSHEFIQTQDAI